MAKKRRGGRSQRHKPGQDYDQDTLQWIQETEESLKDILNPMESHIMAIQSVLVWEKPWHSLAMLVTVNVLFWLATTMAFYPLMGLTGMLLVFVDVWCSAIWPDIRASLRAEDDGEGWTPIHPRLLSVPELCRPVAESWVYLMQQVQWIVEMRRDFPPKFFLLMVFLFTGLAVFGRYVSGITLSYLSVMCLLFGPAIKYHNITGRIYDKVEPAMLQMETSLHIKRKEHKGKHRTGEGSSITGPQTDSDSDAALEEFVPAQDPRSDAVLTRVGNLPQAGQDDENNSGLLTPGSLSGGPSRDISDAEHEEEMSFTQGLTLPSFDDSRLDDSFSSSISNGHDHEKDKTTPDNDLNNDLEIDSEHDLEPPELATVEDSGSDDLDTTIEQNITITSPPESPELKSHPAGSSKSKDSRPESMTFVSSHFKDSDSDEESLARGLAFPDIDDALRETEQEKTALEKAAAVLTSERVTKTVGGFMASTMSGLTRIGETVRAAASGRQSSIEKVDEAAQEGAMGGPQGSAVSDQSTGASLSQSSDTDILAEFEFLEQEELDNLDPDTDSGAKL